MPHAMAPFLLPTTLRGARPIDRGPGAANRAVTGSLHVIFRR
jgi:hypothetical protein